MVDFDQWSDCGEVALCLVLIAASVVGVVQLWWGGAVAGFDRWEDRWGRTGCMLQVKDGRARYIQVVVN